VVHKPRKLLVGSCAKSEREASLQRGPREKQVGLKRGKEGEFQTSEADAELWPHPYPVWLGFRSEVITGPLEIIRSAQFYRNENPRDVRPEREPLCDFLIQSSPSNDLIRTLSKAQEIASSSTITIFALEKMAVEWHGLWFSDPGLASQDLSWVTSGFTISLNAISSIGQNIYPGAN